MRNLPVLALMILLAVPAVAVAQVAPPPPATPVSVEAKSALPDFTRATAVPRVGYDVFRIKVADLAPGPVDDAYRLSPGDQVQVRVWGALQLTFELVVSADQYLEIPDVPGRVYVGGLGLRDVTDRVRRHLATAYAVFFNLENPAASTAFVDLALSKVRDIRFLVQGEVEAPGSYTLHPSLSSLIYGLAKAGGIKESGSLRDIRIRRGDQTVTVDFFDFLFRGTVTAAQLQLQQGDVVFVPLKTREVTLQGEVRRPGIYTLKASTAEDLNAVLEFAGGVLPTATTSRVLIRRTEVNVGPRTLSINLEAERAAGRRVPLLDADIVHVVKASSARRDFVELRGDGIRVAGEYQFVAGMRLSDLIAAAGGLAPEAFLDRAELRRTGADLRQTFQAVNLGLVMQRDPAHDLPVQALDVFTIYSVGAIRGGNGSVTLQGYVKESGTFPLSDGMRLSDLLFARAGVQDATFMRDAYLARGEISRVTAGSTRRELLAFDLGRLLAGDGAQDRLLQPDDVVTLLDRRVILGAERFVTLSGHVKTPGRHPLQDGMRVADLLRGPGGFEDPDHRRLAYLPRGEVWRQVGRGDRIDRELLRFDLGALLGGDAAQNLVLQSGDEVVLYAARDFTEAQTVEIGGEVNRPGTHALAANMTLADLLVRAGGLRDLADPTTVDVFRVQIGADGRVGVAQVEVSLQDQTFQLRNRDRVQVRPRPGVQAARVIEVSGHVATPGRYSFESTGRVADLVRLAGGLTDGAFVEGAVFLRGDKAGTRVVFDLARALDDASSPDNLVLFDGDRLHVPGQALTVTVTGGPRGALTIAWSQGKGVDHYLAAAGGLPAGMTRADVRVLLPNGRFAADRFLRGPEVRPGSTVVIPESTSAPVPTVDDEQVLLEVEVGAVEGTCPAVTIVSAVGKVVVSDLTKFDGTVCGELAAGVRLHIRAARVTTDVFRALEVRRRPK